MDPELEKLVWRRSRFACEYCLIPQAFDRLRFEIDHVIAASHAHGGVTIASNLALTCFPCNRFKGPNLAGIDPHFGSPHETVSPAAPPLATPFPLARRTTDWSDGNRTNHHPGPSYQRSRLIAFASPALRRGSITTSCLARTLHIE